MFKPLKPALLRIAAAGALVGLALAAAPASAAVSLSINIGDPQPYVQIAPPRHGYHHQPRAPERWDGRYGARGAPRYVEHGYYGRAPYAGSYGYARPGHAPRGGYAQP